MTLEQALARIAELEAELEEAKKVIAAAQHNIESEIYRSTHNDNGKSASRWEGVPEILQKSVERINHTLGQFND